MKNLLNNPWVVMALAVLALAMLVWSIAKPFMGGPEFSSDEDPDDWMDNDLEEKTSVLGKMALEAVSTQNLYWNRQPQRDPFSRDMVIKVRDVKKIEDQVNTKSNDKVYSRPVLSALVAGEHTRYAVINDQIVQEGDRVAGMSVSKIAPDGVWLSSSQRSYKLTLSAEDGY